MMLPEEGECSHAEHGNKNCEPLVPTLLRGHGKQDDDAWGDSEDDAPRRGRVFPRGAWEQEV
jgi:hypothetical protein